ncbi:unnamed protein product [Effrenium voratum]|uniref:Uncharacterized protein n=1 Tax=Effrenium voratum TaxID=2562239 RepID=A0AA36NIG8_9DINO|nr:unnamed protein product [Effrenium voratum]
MPLPPLAAEMAAGRALEIEEESVRPPPKPKSQLLASLSTSTPLQMAMDPFEDGNVVVQNAFCFCFEGCIPEMNTGGCACRQVLLCCEMDCCLKQNTMMLDWGFWNVRFQTKSLVKSQMQCCCCVSGFALPPDEQVPLMCVMCWVDLFPKFGAVMRISDLRQKEKPLEPEELNEVEPIELPTVMEPPTPKVMEVEPLEKETRM